MTTTDISRRASVSGITDESSSLTRADDLESLFASLSTAVEAAMDADTLFLAMYNGTSRMIDVVWQREADAVFPGGSFPLGDGLTSEVIRTRRSRLIRHWSQEAKPVQLQYLTARPGLPESALVVPVLLGDQVLGVIAVHKYAPDGFSKHDLHVLESIAARTAIALSAMFGSQRLSAQLHARVSELEAVLGTMPDAVLMVDHDGRLVGLNRAARELLCVDHTSLVLGQPLEQHVGGLWPLGAHEIALALMPMLETLRSGQVPKETAVHLEHGGQRILMFNGTPLVDAEGCVAGSVLLVRDVTRQRRIDELKDEMLSVASHDLKTPVTVIRSDAQFMRREIARHTTTIDQIDEGLLSIIRQTDRLARLLSLLLDVSRIEAGRFEISPRLVNLGTLVATVAAEVQVTSNSHHHVDVRVSGQPTGYWDERRLQQVVQNLLTNAVKYSPGSETIEVSVVAHKTSVGVSVTDHGVGLTADEAQHVFERFFRARKK